MKSILASLALVVTTLAVLTMGCSDNSPAQIRAALADAGLLNDAGLLPDGFTLAPDGAVLPPLHSVGGTVVGLQGSGLVLEGDGVEDITVAPSGGASVPFTFPTSVPAGTQYSIAVKTQPGGPSQTCHVTADAGTVGNADVTTVVVNCATNAYTVGGSIAGLLGTGLTLQNKAGDTLAVNPGATSFVFATPVASGSGFAVTVSGNPTGPSQNCSVTPGTDAGTVTSGDVTSVQIVCTTIAYAVGGSVTGLQGTNMVLQDNGGDDLTVNSNGKFTFSKHVLSGGKFAVTIKSMPSNPGQTCTVSGGNGTVGSGPALKVAVACTSSSFLVGGRVTGLQGGGLVLSSTSGGLLSIGGNGPFSFPLVSSGVGYTVTVNTQPSTPPQACTVTGGSGTVTTMNVTNILVSCISSGGFSVGGTVTGLGTHGITLVNSNGDSVQLAADGAFQFPTLLADGTGYDVAVGTPPGGQICTVKNGVGTIVGANVSNVVVNCPTRVGTACNYRPRKGSAPFLDACGVEHDTAVGRDGGSSEGGTNFDDCQTGTPRELPFAFPLCGVPYTTFDPSMDGWVEFGSGEANPCAYGNTAPFPDPQSPTPAIFVYDEDLNQRNPLCLATFGTAPNRQYVIESKDAEVCCDNPDQHMTFELILNESDGSFDLVYQTLTTATEAMDGSNCQVGVQDTSANASVTYEAFTPGTIYPGLSLHFAP